MSKQKNKIKKAKKLLNSVAPKGESLAYINKREARMLEKAGGLGKDINNTGIKSYVDFGGPGEGYGTASDTFSAASGATPSGPSRSDTGGDSGFTSPKGKGPTKTVSSGGSQPRRGGGAGGAAALSIIGKAADITGLGLAYKYGKKGLETIQRIATPKVAKDTAKARLSGSFTTKYQMKRQPPRGPISEGGDSEQPIKKPLIPKAKPIQPQKQTFNAQSFFPFRAYKSGGVPSGPPPEKGPNSQMPVKMKGGGNMSCPHRPDGIKGIGKAIRGFSFKGTK
tara:strand:- start:158 stop:997 length:840 start_codon:yes stop_codon:yes gene_type:complete